MAFIAPIIAAIVAAGTAAGQAGIAAKTAEEKKKLYDELQKRFDAVPLAEYEKSTIGGYKPGQYALSDDISFDLLKRDPETRQKIINAIEEFKNMSDSNITSKADAARAAAAMDYEQSAGARNAALRSSMQASGRGGSGLEYGLQDKENQAAANSRYMAGLTAATGAQGERLAALKGYQDSVSGNENTDLGIQEKNAATTNQFNTLNKQRRDNINQMNTGLLNDAMLKNIGFSQWNLLRNDANSSNSFNQQMTKAGGAKDVTEGKSKVIGDEGSNYAVALKGLSDMAGKILLGTQRKEDGTTDVGGS